MAANLWGADLLIILSDIDGVYNKNPKDNSDAKLIEEVHDIESLKKEIDSAGKSNFGTGGVVTKITAEEMVTKYGIHLVLANGTKPDILRKIAEGTEKATIFYGK